MNICLYLESRFFVLYSEYKKVLLLSELKDFLERLNYIVNNGDVDKNITLQQQVVQEINEFLFNKRDGLGTVHILGADYDYFSPWHKFWKENHEKILALQIDDDKCDKVADELHDIYLRTQGRAFQEIYDTCGLDNETICKIRFLTANQDFNGSREFSDLATIYQENPEIFNIDFIINKPEDFLTKIKVGKISQNDKRASFAKNIAQFFVEHNCEPIPVINDYNRDVIALKKDLIARGCGFAEKKANMLIRDMYVQGIWTDIKGFSEIDVPSDINTIKVALRTGILTTAIPLVSSFLDIFSSQYECVDKMNAKAWRRVWEIWNDKYPDESISSPCLLDYFVYKTVGREICKSTLFTYTCANGHMFKWKGGRKRKCIECNGEIISKESCLPCMDDEGVLVIRETAFYKSGMAEPNITCCPFKTICTETNKRNLQPPKSISIRQNTGWETAYTDKGAGGGGLMS